MGFFSSIFQKPQTSSIEHLLVDIHSHLLPGIDDGAPTLDHTIGMIRKFHELGYRKLIMTPHVMSGVYDNTPEIIQEKLALVKSTLSQLQISMELEASAEYFFDETFLDKINKNELLPFHGNHILFEFSFHNQPDRIEDLVFLLKTKGFQPVLAHFERYMYFHPSIEMANKLRERGCLIQVNWNSFTGHYGPAVQAQAFRLLKAGLIDILGSDCHRIEHLNMLNRFLESKQAQKVLSRQYLNASFFS